MDAHAALALAYRFGEKEREAGVSFAEAKQLSKSFRPEIAEAYLKGYRGPVDYPQYMGSGAHLPTVYKGL